MSVRERIKEELQWLVISRWQALRFRLQPPVTDVILKLLLQVNQSKDRSLSWRLHNIADEYDPRPTGQWRPL